MPITLLNWPPVVDDTGTTTDGTLFNAAYNQAVHDVVKALSYGVANPATSAASIIDEVIQARGSTATLDTRLDVALHEDGTLKSTTGLVTKAQAASRALNLFVNGDLRHWSAGAGLPPDSFTLLGAGATVVRTGAGEIDTYTFGAGPYAVKMTRAGADCSLGQDVIPTTDFANFTELATARTYVSAAVLCKTSVANQCRIIIDDGVAQTVSDFHSGGGTEEMLFVSHQMSATATKLNIRVQMLTTNGAAYFGGFGLVVSELPPKVWVPYSGYDNRLLKTPRLASIYTPVQCVNAAETDLQTFTMAPGLAGLDGQVVRVEAHFDFAANANAKTVRFYFDGNLLGTIVPGLAANGVSGHCSVLVYRQGAGATAQVQGVGLVTGFNPTITTTSVTVGGIWAGECVIKFTGQGTVTGDVVQTTMTVELI